MISVEECDLYNLTRQSLVNWPDALLPSAELATSAALVELSSQTSV